MCDQCNTFTEEHIDLLVLPHFREEPSLWLNCM